MRSKIFTTVIVAVIVVPFAYIAASDAVSIKQHLDQQTAQIHHLNTETVKLDKQLEKTQTQKEQTIVETQQLEQQTADAVTERQRLEAELGAN